MAGREFTRDETKEWIDNQLAKPDVFNFVICLKDPSQFFSTSEQDVKDAATVAALPALSDGRPIIGSIGTAFSADEVGYMLHPTVWGRGIAVEVLKVFVPAMFAHVGEGMKKVVARTEAKNARSNGLLKKLGFKDVGVEDFGTDPIRGSRSIVIYELSREEAEKWAKA
jgi:RimJ/RimL family protein N-acetyltransferase